LASPFFQFLAASTCWDFQCLEAALEKQNFFIVRQAEQDESSQKRRPD
jgi:hypothetical protein